MFSFLKKIFGTAQSRRVKKFRKIVDEVNRLDEEFNSLTDNQLKQKTQEFKERHKKGQSLDDLLPEAYAVCKNACRRMVGTPVHVSGYDQPWDMVPYDVQIIGAIALHKGCITEMMTGEGKTLTAVMPCYLNALTEKPVHLVTVNDYLANRDCEWVGSVLRWLGLTTGALTNETPLEERKALYMNDVVYGTNSEFGFDYLRDNSMASTKQDQVQRGHYFTIIDEVDSVLIDEARTPLIISGPVPESRQMYDELKEGVSDLVKKQREYCSFLASQAKKTLDSLGLNEKNEEVQQAIRKMWLVSKGTPRNKVLKRLIEDPDMRAALDKMDLYFHSDVNKQERIDTLADLYIIIEEKSNEFELTDKGIGAWQEITGAGGDDFVLMDIAHEYLKIDQDSSLTEEEKVRRKLEVQEEDAKRKERAHNLRQLLRAHLMMERDVDYIVQEGKIVIIDENTGRPQPGRRFADGLHQSIEAKEGVAIQKETQTYATITLQNFFRMYEKLAGMTGTAITEAAEFKQIYKLDVLEIPTNKPCIRVDHNDEIYMTEREKYNAILKDVREVNAQGRPILIGTESVEVSEKLSRIFRQNNLTHTVLNAKHHEREAEIVAHAGQKSAITIATNMAGRGTDIKLGEGIAKLGGLYVMGSTRHQSRRIDRQLRGRCARQGDPGSSKFYVSFEDPLLRLFASPRMTGILQRFRPPEGEPISAGILNRSIETAQKRVEQRNYTIRKHTLEYDDVMNKQRRELYSFRNEVIHTDDIETIATELIHNVVGDAVDHHFISRGQDGGWNPAGFSDWLMRSFPVSFDEGTFDQDHLEAAEIESIATERLIAAFQEKLERENKKVARNELHEEAEKPATGAIRNLMIRRIDQRWQEHLLTMDHLRTDVSLRAVGQRDPLMEFKHEAFRLFDAFSRILHKEITQDFFRFEIVPREHPSIAQLLASMKMEKNRSLVDEIEEKAPPSGSQEAALEAKPAPITVDLKVGRNDPCPCGSGKKYKKCCGLNVENVPS